MIFKKARECMIANLACEQAFLLGKSREVTREPHAKREVLARGRERKESSPFPAPLSLAPFLTTRSLRSPLEMES